MALLNPLTIPRGDVRYVRKQQEVACLSSDSVGNIVCLRDVSTTTGRWRVEKANCYDETKMPAIGVLISKTTPTTGIMVRIGEVDGIFSSLNPKLHYFVGENGDLVTPEPTAPVGVSVIVQAFGIPISNDILFLTGEINRNNIILENSFNVDSILVDDNTGNILSDDLTHNVLVDE